MRAMHIRLPLAASALFAFVFLALGAPSWVEAAPKKKKYYFKLAAVTAKDEVKPDAAKEATPRVEAGIKKVFSSHEQLVAEVEGAPDPDQKADAYRKYLTKKGVAGAYLVTVEITDASIEIVPEERKPKTQRLVVRMGVHILGENMPGRTMGFTGDGSATIKQEVGMKVSDSDRKYTWDQATDAAIADAMQTVFKQLAVPPKKQ